MGIRAWWKRRHLDEEDFKEEIRAHLAIAASERVADGDDPREARYAALREFGNVTLATDATRRVWMPRWLQIAGDLTSDVRYALRALAKNPVFSLAVVAVLTIGIGLNAAVFTVVKSLSLTPVAGVEGSARLATVFGETPAGRPLRLSYPDYRYLRDHDRAFSGLFGSIFAQVGLGRGRGSRSIWTELVTGNYFQILGVGAELGRTLLPSDEIAPGRHPVVVISGGLWRRDFAADPGIIGRTIELNSVPLTVVGVVDPAFFGTTIVYDVEAYVPVMTAPQLGFNFGSRHSTPSGILADPSAALFYPQGYPRPGTSLGSATAQVDALWRAISQGRTDPDTAERLRVVPFWRTPNGPSAYVLPTLVLLTAMGLLVLIIACANIAGLVLVRGVSRRGEIAVRLALGAARARIVRLLVVENLVLAIPGAMLGVILAGWTIPFFVGYAETMAAPQRVHFNTSVDTFVIAFAVLAACGSALVFGFAPAIQSSRVDLVSVINEDASPRGASRGRLRSGLVIAQVAVSVLLLFGAGLVARSLEASRRAHPGFDVDRVASISLDLKQNGYDEARGRQFFRQLLDAVRADPAAESVTLATYEPVNLLTTRTQPVALAGYEPRRDEDMGFLSNAVAPGYFRTLRVPVLAGREFEDRDDETAAPVAIVNRTLADRFFGGAERAIGQRIQVAGGAWRTVVGVAADLKYLRVDEAPRPYFYLPLFQAYRPAVFLHARSRTEAEGFVERTRAQVAALDPDLPVLFARPLAGRLAGSLFFLNLAAAVLSVFGVAGLALAAMGTYGLVSYVVRQSAREIGIRMALGASGPSVVRAFVVRGLTLGALGASVGVVLALAVGRLLRTVLYGVSATDAASFAGALGVVLAGVLLATLVPAWRAARTNPLSVLRHH